MIATGKIPQNKYLGEKRCTRISNVPIGSGRTGSACLSTGGYMPYLRAANGCAALNASPTRTISSFSMTSTRWISTRRSGQRPPKNAGMKYAVMTAKHHDGFCLFDSKLTDYKSTNTPAGRDLVREYVEAFRAEGIKGRPVLFPAGLAPPRLPALRRQDTPDARQR